MARCNASSAHVIVLPGGGYSQHVAHEAEPIVGWLQGLGVQASVFRYPLLVRHPNPLQALRAEIHRLRTGGAERIGLIGFSAGGHLAGLAALAPGADPGEEVEFAVLGYTITSMETETYRLARSLAAHGVPHTVHVFAHGPHTASASRTAVATRSSGRRSRRRGLLSRAALTPIRRPPKAGRARAPDRRGPGCRAPTAAVRGT